MGGGLDMCRWTNPTKRMNTSTRICLMVMVVIWSGKAIQVKASDYQAQKSSSNVDDGSPANYKFQYAVNDDSSGSDFGHEEERNGHKTRGQYRVLLPDGRLQIVKYTADENGYNAEVTYENRGGGNGGYNSYSAPAPISPPSPSKSYGVPPPPSEQQSYSASGESSSSQTSSGSGNSNSFGKRNSGSFVKLRSNVKGRNYNYAF